MTDQRAGRALRWASKQGATSPAEVKAIWDRLQAFKRRKYHAADFDGHTFESGAEIKILPANAKSLSGISPVMHIIDDIFPSRGNYPRLQSYLRAISALEERSKGPTTIRHLPYLYKEYEAIIWIGNFLTKCRCYTFLSFLIYRRIIEVYHKL